MIGDLTVKIHLSQTGDFMATADLGEKQPVIRAGYYVGAIPGLTIIDDDIDEPDGSVVATLIRDDANYTLGSPASLTHPILDDDLPALAITADAPSKEEGAPAVFTIRIIGQAPASPVVIDNLTVAQEGNFFPEPPPTSVTIPAGETVFKLTIRTVDN